ncbi:MAG: sigma-54-dependent Fis family transcriptional regulator [Acidobacteria bacterium]|nr:sigma-54-dependent Fis family transcriptional regulator [Acidobacteriota bacterium]
MAKGERILVIDDDDRVREALSNLLKSWDYNVDVACNGTEGWAKIVSTHPVVVISDLRMPEPGGLQLLKQTRELNSGVYFIVLSGHGSIQTAVEATKLGAYSFLEKPVDPGRLQIELRNCLDRHESERQLQIAHRRLRDMGALGKFVGRSKGMQEIMSLITMVAPSSASVLITGASGTGKEIVARTIHELSPCRGHSFVAVNCAAIPETLIESELFGHEKGSFTGAVESRMGCFELADGGTLLLDEVGEMPAPTQVKLLRVLEESKVRRIGAKAEIPVSVRVLAATNRVPEDAIKAGKLRSDLYYRLNVIRINIPPLREHLEDLDDLCSHLIADLCRKHNRPLKTIDPEALMLMRRHTWPGNVRELRNTIERALLVSHSEMITAKDLPAVLNASYSAGNNSDNSRIEVGLTLDEAEYRLILQTLASTNNNRTRAAQILGITTKTLYNKLKRQ